MIAKLQYPIILDIRSFYSFSDRQMLVVNPPFLEGGDRGPYILCLSLSGTITLLGFFNLGDVKSYYWSFFHAGDFAVRTKYLTFPLVHGAVFELTHDLCMSAIAYFYKTWHTNPRKNS